MASKRSCGGYRIRTAQEIEQVIQNLKDKGVLDEITDVLGHFGVTHTEAWGNLKHPPIVAARYACFAHLREKYSWSYPQIGRTLMFDHTTVMHGLRTKAETRSRLEQTVGAADRKARLRAQEKQVQNDLREQRMVMRMPPETMVRLIAAARGMRLSPSQYVLDLLDKKLGGIDG